MAKTSNIDNFDLAFDWLMKAEGGTSDHSADRGGLTKYGISQAAYPHLDISRITKNFARNIYLRDYWLPANCDELPWPLCLAVFDAAVNHGVRNASRLLQGSVGAIQDGVIGPRTMRAVMKQDQNELLVKFNTRRSRFFYQIVANDRGQHVFINGWLNRLFRLTQYIYREVKTP